MHELITVSLGELHDNPAQPRKGKDPDLKALTESVRQVGIISPITITRNGDGFIVVAGHRRVAAAKAAGLTEIPAHVMDGDSYKQLLALLAENTVRRDLTAVEEASVIQTALDLGVKDADIVKAVGRDKAAVAAAKVIVAAKPAELKVLDDVPIQPTLEEAATLIELAPGLEDWMLDELTAVIGTPEFMHEAERDRQSIARHKAKEDAIAMLADAGVKYASYRDWGWASMDECKTTPAAHVDCAGHCATVDWRGNVSYWCSTPEAHGIEKRSHGSQPVVKDKEAEKAKREMRKAHKAAQAVRIEWLQRLMLKRKADKAVLGYCVGFARDNGLCALNGWTVDSKRAKEIVGDLTPLHEHMLLALVAGHVEKQVDDAIKYGSFPLPRVTGTRFADYLELLKGLGYGSTACEDDAADRAAIAAMYDAETCADSIEEMDDDLEEWDA